MPLLSASRELVRQWHISYYTHLVLELKYFRLKFNFPTDAMQVCEELAAKRLSSAELSTSWDGALRLLERGGFMI